MLPILSKILKKHVHTCLYEFLLKHKLLVKSQFWFCKNHSCQTALISLTENMHEAINVKKYFGMVQLDLSKAFDLVNHSLLIQKLKLYRCDNSSIKWFLSYLSNRTQRVTIKQTLSEPKPITAGTCTSRIHIGSSPFSNPYQWCDTLYNELWCSIIRWWCHCYYFRWQHTLCWTQFKPRN